MTNDNWLCEACNDTGKPQIVVMTTFNGDFKEPTCDNCGVKAYR